MRTYKNIVHDYLNWFSDQTKDGNYIPENYFRPYNDDKTRYAIEFGRVFKNLLAKCYHPTLGSWYFTTFILGDMQYAGTFGHKVCYNKLWFEWDGLLPATDHLCIACQRGGGKTLKFSIIEPLKRGYLFNNHKTIIAGSSEDQVSEEIITPIKTTIVNNQALLSKCPDIRKAKWTNTFITYNNGYIIGKGVGGSILGKHVDYIVNDDILQEEGTKKMSDEAIKSYVLDTLDPMITVRRGQMVVVGTPKAETDIFHFIVDKIKTEPGTSWVFRRYPAILDYDKKILQLPCRFTWNQLIQKRLDLGAWRFEKEYQVSFIPQANALFPNNLLKMAQNKGRELNFKTRHVQKEGDTEMYYYFMGVDLARSGEASADNSVYTVVQFNPETQEKIPVYAEILHGVKINRQVRRIAEISRGFNNCPILVEQNNIGQDFIDLLVDNYNCHVEIFKMTSTSKENLIRLLIANFEQEKIILPYGDDFTRHTMKQIIEELRRFRVEVTPAGNEVFRGLPHDDCVISLALAVKCTLFGGNTPFIVDRFDKPSKLSNIEKMIRDGVIK